MSLRNLYALDLTSEPCTKTEFELYGEKFPLAPIDQDELDIFKAQFGAILSMPGSDERRVQLDRIDLYLMAMRAIKQELNGPKFTGLNPEDTELGMSLIRPQFTVAGSQTTYKYNWQIALTTSWADWLYAAAGNPYTIGKDFGMIVTHLKSLITPTPFMSECRFQVGRTGILIPSDVRALRTADTTNGVAIVAIPTMVLKPKSSFYSRAKADAGNIGTDEVALGGLVFGLGRVLKEETATWTT